MNSNTRLEKPASPGPGHYQVQNVPFYTGVNAPAYSCGRRSNYFFKNCAPGPNVYMANVNNIRQSQPAYSMYVYIFKILYKRFGVSIVFMSIFYRNL